MMKRLLITICSFAFLATWAKGHYDSIHGRIGSDWKMEGDTFHWKVEVPANTTATLYFPAGHIRQITEDGRATLDIGSGVYTFTASYE